MDDNNPKDEFFKDLRDHKEHYVDPILNRYRKRVPPFRAVFVVTSGLAILGSVSLPYLAQITNETNKAVISLVSLGVALLTALNSFFGWRLTWQKVVAATTALEHYIACWEIDLAKAYREDYDKAKQDAYLATSYLFTQALATRSAESETFFAQLKPLTQEPEKRNTSHPSPPSQ
jgi:hypothetical protein